MGNQRKRVKDERQRPLLLGSLILQLVVQRHATGNQSSGTNFSRPFSCAGKGSGGACEKKICEEEHESC